MTRWYSTSAEKRRPLRQLHIAPFNIGNHTPTSSTQKRKQQPTEQIVQSTLNLKEKENTNNPEACIQDMGDNDTDNPENIYDVSTRIRGSTTESTFDTLSNTRLVPNSQSTEKGDMQSTEQLDMACSEPTVVPSSLKDTSLNGNMNNDQDIDDMIISSSCPWDGQLEEWHSILSDSSSEPELNSDEIPETQYGVRNPSKYNITDDILEVADSQYADPLSPFPSPAPSTSSHASARFVSARSQSYPVQSQPPTTDNGASVFDTFLPPQDSWMSSSCSIPIPPSMPEL